MNTIKNLKLKMEKGMSIDDAIQWLCDSGASKVESIANLAQVYSVPMTEVKVLVHAHKAWGNVKTRDDGFHDELISKMD